jgi:hypothetical protein
MHAISHGATPLRHHYAELLPRRSELVHSSVVWFSFEWMAVYVPFTGFTGTQQ